MAQSIVPVWEFLLTDLSGNTLGELTNADTRQVNLPLNRVPTATCRIPTTHYLAPYVTDPAFDCLVKCYRNGTLVFIGPVVSGQEASDGKSSSIVITASSPLWRLNYRLLGVSSAGTAYGTQAVPVNLGAMVTFALATANTQGYTGISDGTYAVTSTGAVGTYFFKPVLEAITEIGTSATGYDFEAAPMEPTNIGQPWPQIAAMNASDLIGTVKPGVVFEYGTGVANVIAYSNAVTRDGMLNSGYMEQPAAASHAGIIGTFDAPSITARGAFHGLVDNGGAEWDILRNALLNQNIAVRKNPRQIVSFTPAPNTVPRPLIEYIVGDTVRARIMHNSVMRLDKMMRVYGIQFDIDKQSNESPTLTLIAP